MECIVKGQTEDLVNNGVTFDCFAFVCPHKPPCMMPPHASISDTYPRNGQPQRNDQLSHLPFGGPSSEHW